MNNIKIMRISKQFKSKSFDELFPEQTIVFYAYIDWVYSITDIPMYKQRLKDLGLLTYSNDVHFLLSRLLLQPSQEITTSILSSLLRPILYHVFISKFLEKRNDVLFFSFAFHKVPFIESNWVGLSQMKLSEKKSFKPLSCRNIGLWKTS